MQGGHPQALRTKAVLTSDVTTSPKADDRSQPVGGTPGLLDGSRAHTTTGKRGRSSRRGKVVSGQCL